MLADTDHGRGLSSPRLQRVLDFIEQNIEQKLSIGALAAVAHLSPFHFARLFKQATGHAPHGYLTQRRIHRAKEMLGGGTLPLVRIATSVGFQTQGHFTEVFRRHAGLTPRHYRLQAQRGAPSCGIVATHAAAPLRLDGQKPADHWPGNLEPRREPG